MADLINKNDKGQFVYAFTPEELEQKVEAYFQHCKTFEEAPTVYGLAWHCGFKSRQSIYDYKQNEEYADIIEHAMLFIAYGYEKQLASGRGDGGIIFAMKNVANWKDKQEIETSSAPISIEIVNPHGAD